MTTGAPPPTPPSRYVWVDERRVESIEAAVARLSHADVDHQVAKTTTRGRFFTAFSKIDTLEQRTESIEKKLDLMLAHFNVVVPEDL